MAETEECCPLSNSTTSTPRFHNTNKQNAMAETAAPLENMRHLSGSTDTDLLVELDEDAAGEVPRDPNYVEDRFRVDRRKLEEMLQGERSQNFFRNFLGFSGLGHPHTGKILKFLSFCVVFFW